MVAWVVAWVAVWAVWIRQSCSGCLHSSRVVTTGRSRRTIRRALIYRDTTLSSGKQLGFVRTSILIRPPDLGRSSLAVLRRSLAWQHTFASSQIGSTRLISVLDTAQAADDRKSLVVRRRGTISATITDGSVTRDPGIAPEASQHHTRSRHEVNIDRIVLPAFHPSHAQSASIDVQTRPVRPASPIDGDSRQNRSLQQSSEAAN